MRRRNLGNKLVKKCIVWAMTFMMVFAPLMSSMGTMSVYAQGVQEEQGTDNSNIEDTVEEVATETETVADVASDLADKVESAVAEVETVVESVEVIEKAGGAEEAINTAENLVGADFDADIKAVNEAAEEVGVGEAETEGEVSVLAETSNENLEKLQDDLEKIYSEMKDYDNKDVSDDLTNAEVAIEAAADQAQKDLEQAVAAADDAEEAYEAAEEKANDAQKILDALIALKDGITDLDTLIAQADSDVVKAELEALKELDEKVSDKTIDTQIAEAENALEAAEEETDEAAKEVARADAEVQAAEAVKAATDALVKEAQDVVAEQKSKCDDDTQGDTWLTVAKAEEDVIDSKAEIAEANKTVDKALTTLDKARDEEENIEKVVAAVQSVKNLDEKISGAQDVLESAKTALEAAKTVYDAVIDTLKTVENNKETIEVYQAWVDALQTKQNNKDDVLDDAARYVEWNDKLEEAKAGKIGAHAYSQIGNMGQNAQEFDSTNEKVVPRANAYFEDLTYRPNGETNPAAGKTVTVPYEMYAEYVKYMSITGFAIKSDNGYGIATGVKDTANMESVNEGATMPIVYWETLENPVEYKDENDIVKEVKITGKFFTDKDDLIPGKEYFVGYSFKYQAGHYHIDGYMFTYDGEKLVHQDEYLDETPTPSTSPEVSPTPDATPDVTPGNTPDTTSDDTPDITPDDTPNDVTTYAEVYEASEAAAVAEEPAVLGVSRTQEGTEDSYYGVLGKRRRPQTGDSAAMSIWASLMALAAGGTGISGAKILKGKKKKDE